MKHNYFSSLALSLLLVASCIVIFSYNAEAQIEGPQSPGISGGSSLVPECQTLSFKIAGEKKPFLVKGICSSCDIFALVQNVINFVWYGIVIPIAALMFVYGGFRLIASAGPEQHTKAKLILTNTVIGIILAFCSWLIVDTLIKVMGGSAIRTDAGAVINNVGPWNKINCQAKPLVVKPVKEFSLGMVTKDENIFSTDGPPLSNAQKASYEAAARDYLEKIPNGGIGVNKPACPLTGTIPGGCTDVSGLPKVVFSKLSDIKSGCPTCPVVITGGDEEGPHKSHGDGIPIVDVRYDEKLAAYLKSNAKSLGIKRICTDASNQASAFNCSTVEPEPHLHLDFSQN